MARRTRHAQCTLQVTQQGRLLCGLCRPHVQHVVQHGVGFHLRYTRTYSKEACCGLCTAASAHSGSGHCLSSIERWSVLCSIHSLPPIPA